MVAGANTSSHKLFLTEILLGAGLIQAVFTISVLIFFIPVYYSFYLSFLWQVSNLPWVPSLAALVARVCVQRSHFTGTSTHSLLLAWVAH